MLHSIARAAADRHGPRPALITPAGWSASFSDLHRLSDEVACGLARRGIGPGDLVALSLPSGVEYAVAYLGLAKLGAITAGINPLLSPAERDHAIRRSGAGLVLTVPGAVPLDGVSGVEVVTVDPAGGVDDVLSDLRVRGGGVAELPADEDRPVAIVFTSGTTTGVPKGALFRNRQLGAALAVENADPWSAGRHVLSSTQFSHVGFMLRLAGYLAQGTTLCLVDKWRAELALELIERYRMPAVNGVGSQVALLLDHPDLDRYDLSSIERVVTGGGPSSPAVINAAIARWNATYSMRYSSTESGGVGTARSVTAPVLTASSNVGTPRGDTQIRIGPADDVCPIGEVGEVCVRSSAVMSEYWRDPETTAATLVDGWLHTGDLGFLDDRGDLHLAGRTTEMFIRGGYNVYPQEVEAVLSRHPGVGAVVVVPRPDDVMGEIGVAVVVARDADVELGALRDFAAGELARFKLPEVLRVVDALPFTSTQKIDRRRLTELVATRSPDEQRVRA